MSETRNILISVGAAIGIAGIITLCVLALLVIINVVDAARRRVRKANDYPVVGDGAWPKTTGPYRTGVRLSHPEPADQVPDDDDRRVPRLPPDWPGLPPKPKRRAL